MKIEVIRSNRRSVAIEVTREGRVIVRAPMRMPAASLEKFLLEKQQWILRALAAQQKRAVSHPEPTPERAAELQRLAKQVLPERVAYYAKRMGLYPTGLRITAARTRFGSCSAKNRICFSWRLMQYAPAAIDYVVVHELAHIQHKNHGKEFYRLIEQYLPDYRERQALLRE